MSGGVDSSVAAALVKRAGYDAVGITLQLYDHGEAIRRKGACCAGQDIHDARAVAAKLDMPHYVLDYESRFKESVMDEFVDSYLSGHTPIPCIRCNETVKFRDLLTTARELGAVALVTGHYIATRQGIGGWEMHRPRDLARDQSYFLFSTTQEQLDFLRFPLAELTKDEIRDLPRLSVLMWPTSRIARIFALSPMAIMPVSLNGCAPIAACPVKSAIWTGRFWARIKGFCIIRSGNAVALV